MEMIRRLEVRPSEGGDDSKLFALDLVQAYHRLAVAQNWKSHSL